MTKVFQGSGNLVVTYTQQVWIRTGLSVFSELRMAPRAMNLAESSTFRYFTSIWSGVLERSNNGSLANCAAHSTHAATSPCTSNDADFLDVATASCSTLLLVRISAETSVSDPSGKWTEKIVPHGEAVQTPQALRDLFMLTVAVKILYLCTGKGNGRSKHRCTFQFSCSRMDEENRYSRGERASAEDGEQ